jgi:hypothetical protein
VWPLAFWGAIATTSLAVFALRKRSLRVAVLSGLTWTVNGAGMIVGLVRGLERDLPRGSGRMA